MAGEKNKVELDIQSDSLDMLKHFADKYKLADESKALRVILDYVIKDGDEEEIFLKKRCLRCGSRTGWEAS
jgi:hypothetical protein